MYINTTCFQHIPKLVPADQNATAGWQKINKNVAI
jgi:hypothetical protein